MIRIARSTIATIAVLAAVLGIGIGLGIAYFPGFGIQPTHAAAAPAPPTATDATQAPAEGTGTATTAAAETDDSIPGVIQIRPSNHGDTSKPGRLFACDVGNTYDPVSVDFSGSTDINFMKVTSRSVMDPQSQEKELNAQSAFVLTFDGDPRGFYPSAVIVDMQTSVGSAHLDQHVLDITLEDVATGKFTIRTEDLNPDAYVSDVIICA